MQPRILLTADCSRHGSNEERKLEATVLVSRRPFVPRHQLIIYDNTKNCKQKKVFGGIAIQADNNKHTRAATGVNTRSPRAMSR